MKLTLLSSFLPLFPDLGEFEESYSTLGVVQTSFLPSRRLSFVAPLTFFLVKRPLSFFSGDFLATDEEVVSLEREPFFPPFYPH